MKIEFNVCTNLLMRLERDRYSYKFTVLHTLVRAFSTIIFNHNLAHISKEARQATYAASTIAWSILAYHHLEDLDQQLAFEGRVIAIPQQVELAWPLLPHFSDEEAVYNFIKELVLEIEGRQLPQQLDPGSVQWLGSGTEIIIQAVNASQSSGFEGTVK